MKFVKLTLLGLILSLSTYAGKNSQSQQAQAQQDCAQQAAPCAQKATKNIQSQQAQAQQDCAQQAAPCAQKATKTTKGCGEAIKNSSDSSSSESDSE